MLKGHLSSKDSALRFWLKMKGSQIKKNKTKKTKKIFAFCD